MAHPDNPKFPFGSRTATGSDWTGIRAGSPHLLPQEASASREQLAPFEFGTLEEWRKLSIHVFPWTEQLVTPQPGIAGPFDNGPDFLATSFISTEGGIDYPATKERRKKEAERLENWHILMEKSGMLPDYWENVVGDMTAPILRGQIDGDVMVSANQSSMAGRIKVKELKGREFHELVVAQLELNEFELLHSYVHPPKKGSYEAEVSAVFLNRNLFDLGRVLSRVLSR